jgi:hypothetical protein
LGNASKKIHAIASVCRALELLAGGELTAIGAALRRVLLDTPCASILTALQTSKKASPDVTSGDHAKGLIFSRAKKLSPPTPS